MKKILFCIIAMLLAITLALLIYLKRPVTLADSKAAELVPGDSVAFLELTDIPRTKDRWKETALYKIAHEPEVQAFLEKPKSKIPRNADVTAKWEQAKKIEPKEAFLAITSITDKAPKFVAGFDYKGNRKDAEALVSDLKGKLKDKYPSGKSDIIQYESEEIETYEAEGILVATVFKEHWFFVSDDLDLLKTTLGRLNGKVDAGTSLRDNGAYKSSLAKLPASADAVVFVQPRAIIERVGNLLAVSNPAFDSKQLDQLKKIQAISTGMKFEGEKIRDALYVLMPGGAAKSPMARNSLVFTSPDTLFYFAAALVNPNGSAPALPNPAIDSSGILSALDALRQGMENAGLSYEDFKQAFGPEVGSLVDWPASAMQPSLLLTLDVKDAAKAGKFVEALTNGQAGFQPWAKQEIDGVQYYSLPQESAGFVAIEPVLALTDKALLFGLNPDAVKASIDNAKKSGSPRLDQSAEFKASSDLVGKPTGAFGYIDSRAFFEKIYGLVSNALKMLSLFNPHANDYADLSKLPSTESISKHLSPIVYWQSSSEDGLLIESIGPVTFNQTVFLLGVAGGAASFRSYQKQGGSFGGNQQFVPSTSVQPVAPPAPPVPTVPDATPSPAASPAPAVPSQP